MRRNSASSRIVFLSGWWKNAVSLLPSCDTSHSTEFSLASRNDASMYMYLSAIGTSCQPIVLIMRACRRLVIAHDLGGKFSSVNAWMGVPHFCGVWLTGGVYPPRLDVITRVDILILGDLFVVLCLIGRICRMVGLRF